MHSVLRSCLGTQTRVSRSKTPGVPFIQIALMRHMAGEKYPYAAPFPYEKRKLTATENIIDNGLHRFCEQSKIVSIEGSFALGKHAFAKRLAHEFDLHYVPGLKADDLHVKFQNGFNLRSLNDAMYDKDNKLQDFKDLYTEDIDSGRIMRTQFECLRQRSLIYAHVLTHVFNTGQGVVTVRSPFSEPVFVKTMSDMGWINPRYNKWHNEKVFDGVQNGLPPHLLIYLDAPVEVVKDNIAKRLEQDPTYQVGPHITEKFLKTFDENYRRWLDKIRNRVEVFELDWAEPADETELDYIWEFLATIPLEVLDVESMLHRSWIELDEDMCYHVRNWNCHPEKVLSLLDNDIPPDVPEFVLHHESMEEREEVYNEHPMAKYNYSAVNQPLYKLLLSPTQMWK